MFLLKFGAQYTRGAINHQTFGEARRELIRRKFSTDISSESLGISDATRASPSPVSPALGVRRPSPDKKAVIGDPKQLLQFSSSIPGLNLIRDVLLTYIQLLEVSTSLWAASVI